MTKLYLLKTYKKEINKLLDTCDWIDGIEDWRMCSVVCDIYRKKGIDLDNNKILKLYKNKVKSLKLSTEQWNKEYSNWDTGMPKIIDMVYEIIEINIIKNNGI